MKQYAQEKPYPPMKQYAQEKPYPPMKQYAQDKPYPPMKQYAQDKPYPPMKQYAQEKPYPPMKPYPQEKPYAKAYPGTHDVKSPKKIKIIDCNNRNINAEGIADFSTIEPALNKAFSSSNHGQIAKPGQTQVIFVEPNTKIIFHCNNYNSNSPPATDGQAAANIVTPTATDNTVVKTTSVKNNDKTGAKSSTNSLGTTQTGIAISKPSTSVTSSPTPSSETGALNSLLPSIQQMNPAVQQMNPAVQQNTLPSGDPMLQLKTSLSPLP
jgi:hypothetical protein